MKKPMKIMNKREVGEKSGCKGDGMACKPKKGKKTK